MSLFNLEEICEGCAHANWHYCDKCIGDKAFCHCEYHFENSVSHTTGSCKHKIESETGGIGST